MDVSFSVSKRIENQTLNYQFEGTKLILVYNGGAAHTGGSHIQVVIGYDRGTYDRGTYDRGARVWYDRGARAWSAHDVRTVADGRASSERRTSSE